MEDKTLSRDEMTDLKLAVGMASKLYMSDKGMQALQQASQAFQDPAQGIGQYVAMLVLKLKEKMMENNIQVSDRIWMADNGVIDIVIRDILRILQAQGSQFPEDAAQQIEEEVLQFLKMAQQSGNQRPDQGSGLIGQGGPNMQPPGPPPQQGGPGIMGGMM